MPLTGEDKIDNERMRKAAEKPFPAHFGYRSTLAQVRAPPTSHGSTRGENSTQSGPRSNSSGSRLGSDLSGGKATTPLVAPQLNATPYISFGEGADPVFKRVVIATHKYVYGLNSHKLIGRLHDLPEENEYAPREMHYSPVTPSHDSNVMLEYTPPDFPRYTSEELRENERMVKRAEKSREILSRYKGSCVEPRSPSNQSSTRLSSTNSQSQTKGTLCKTRSSRIEKNTGHNQNITPSGSLSQRAVRTKNPSPNRQPKRSRRGLNSAARSGKLAAQEHLKSSEAQKQLSKVSREPVQTQRLPDVRQEPLRASRRLSGKQPELDMLPYGGTAAQKREAPRRRSTDDVGLRSPPCPNRSPRNKKIPSKAAKPQGIVKPETKPTNRARKQKKWPGS